MAEDAPKVFVSHASEDKPFVLEFAKSLRANGVDCWVDEWEILPGDRLIDKIFEQGIGQSDAFIIVLSRNSVRKPWVVEELDAALIKRIKQQTKIIPIRTDDCEVPVALQATAWINIDPTSDYETEFHKVLSSIFDESIKPPIGTRPRIFRSTPTVGRYNLQETRILEFILKQQREKNHYHVTEFRDAFPDIPPEVVNDTIEAFKSDLLIKVYQTFGTAPYGFSSLELRPFGWVKYAPIFLDIDTESDINSVLALIVSEGSISGSNISQKLDMEPVRVNMTVDYLDSRRYVRCRRTAGCAPFTFTTVEATAQGRRSLRG